MNIIDFIPIGSNNAITRARLCELTGMRDREVRERISIACNDNVIINLQDGNGYFIPDETERFLIERYYHQELSRLKANAKKVKMLREVLKQ
jgi:hypothetical protein